MPKHHRRDPLARTSTKAPVVIEPPGFVDLSEANRREAVAALADLLATWWEHRRPAADDDLTSSQSGASMDGS
jgi:hypothetical protein